MQHSPYGSGADSTAAASPNVPVSASAQAAAGQQSAHQRTYQACIPCRNRKVRCDLGSVDNPHDPPCSRCRRESKDCFFSLTRRKKKDGTYPTEQEQDAEAYEVKTGRKRVRLPQPPVAEPSDRPRTPGGSYGSNIPLQRPQLKSQQFGEEDIKASEQTTAILQGAEVHGGHDALKVLMEAAGIRGRTGSTTSSAWPGLHGPSPASLPSATSPIIERARPMHDGRSYAAARQEPIMPEATVELVSSDEPGYAAAVKAWSRFRFVRAGWFTPKEGIAYVSYFYQFLSPLTPITLPDFRAVEYHEKLLTEEPMLAITILLIASRHMRLEGPGAMSRPYTIHQKLWTYLQGMIDRVTWGQEQFGGGFAGAGSQPGCDVNPLTRKGLRTLGTVESFMLLTEWHPRAMHFPPDEADDELMVPNEPFATPDPEGDDSAKGIGGQRMDSWLEPCWRSDRMCWMLLGMAMSLAFEIGVFDKSEWQRHATGPGGLPPSASELQQYDKRRANVRDLLLIYVTMTSGRLGLTSMLPSNYSKPEDSELYKTRIGEHDSVQEQVLQFWLRIAAIMRDGNKKIFANKTFTRDLIKTGMYKAALEQFKTPLDQWRAEFDNCMSIPKYMRHMLEIEYEYCRVYLNALSLQAVAERCANEFPTVNDPPLDLSRPSSITTNGVRTDVAIGPQALSKWLGGDRKYMDEVRNAACNLLTVVVEGLYPGEYLRHAPVRAYFRIISVAIMLLKSFSLGASETDVTDSFNLMDQVVKVLRTCIVDDVHVASRFADLLDTLTQNLKPRLVRISADSRSHKPSVRTTPVSGAEATKGSGFTAADRPNGVANMSNTADQSWTYDQQNRNGYNAQQNVLSGISDNIYDISGMPEYSIMPPPSFGLQSPPSVTTPNGTVQAQYAPRPVSTTTGTGASYMASGYQGVGDLPNGWNDLQDWLTLPLDPLLGLTGVDVNQTMYGPELGGQDMLELLLNGSHGPNY